MKKYRINAFNQRPNNISARRQKQSSTMMMKPIIDSCHFTVKPYPGREMRAVTPVVKIVNTSGRHRRAARQYGAREAARQRSTYLASHSRGFNGNVHRLILIPSPSRVCFDCRACFKAKRKYAPATKSIDKINHRHNRRRCR